MPLFRFRREPRRTGNERLRLEAARLRDALASESAETARLLLIASDRLKRGEDSARVADILALFSEISRPDRPFAGAPVAVAGPLAELIERYRERVGYPEREILYIEDGGGDWLTASIERPLFIRAIGELLENCLDHAGGWSRITVTSEPVPGAILVRVRDDGQGLPDAAPEAARSVRGGSDPGDPESRAGDVAGAAGSPTGAPGDGKPSGTEGTGSAARVSPPGAWEGLGLALVRRILTLHGGRIEFSTHAGHGTAVSTWWPAGTATTDERRAVSRGRRDPGDPPSSR